MATAPKRTVPSLLPFLLPAPFPRSLPYRPIPEIAPQAIQADRSFFVRYIFPVALKLRPKNVKIEKQTQTSFF